ncbi:hypothetical protein AB9F34_34695, partial [Rhizobium leguminosarum]|uniref:hypothetical protein n=1 Tax=Rhizobium leguminosarum TaxID=384 RepID=UPI003F9668F4
MALKDAKSGTRNEAGIAAVLGILNQSFGERFQTGQSFRETISCSAGQAGYAASQSGCPVKIERRFHSH